MGHTTSPWVTVESRRNNARWQGPVFAMLLTGTGGNVGADPNQVLMLFGTGSVAEHAIAPVPAASEQSPVVQLQAVREALRLGVADIALLFSVSRQTIYNWQSGNSIDAKYAQRLRAIANAVEPHFNLFNAQAGRVANRPIEGRSTLLELLSQGHEPRDTVTKLVNILEQEAAQRERLANLLRGRRSNRGAAEADALG